MPWYNFETDHIAYPTLFKFYTCGLLLIKIFWNVKLATNDFIQQLYGCLMFSQKIIFILTYLDTNFLVVLTTVKTSFLDNSKWKMLLENVKLVDLFLGNRGKREKSVWTNYYFSFTIKHVVMISVGVYTSYIWSKAVDVPFFDGIYMGPIFDIYYHFQLTIVLTTLVKVIRVRYEDLSTKLVKTCEETKLGDFVVEIRNMASIFRILGDSIEVFNEIFGFRIILLMFHWGLQIITCLNFTFIITADIDGQLQHHFLLSNVCILGFEIVSF